MQFVAADRQVEQIPCRFVQLTSGGVTIDSLYRCGSNAETEEALRKWLQERIHELEQRLSESSGLPFSANF